MSDLRTAAQQALEVLEDCSSEYGHRCNRCDSEVDEGGKVAAALRAALAQQQAEPVEPVAWRTFDGEGGYEYRAYEDNECYAAAWAQRNPNHVGWVEPLYTASPQPTLGYARKIEQLIAQRDALLEVVQKFVAWSEAERDHSGTTFWQRVEMCREVDALAHAAIKAVEAGA